MIDWNRLEELKEEIGEEDLNEVLVLFVEEVRSTIASLSTQDTLKFAEDMHFIKSSALNIGFADLAEETSRREHEARSGVPSNESPQAPLQEMLERTCSALKRNGHYETQVS